MTSVRRARHTAFDSPEFDALADRMGTSRLMRRNVHGRYFKTQRNTLALTRGGAIFFGAALFDMMTQDQRLAIVAHEFAHVLDHDNLRNFVYLRFPPALIWAAIGVWTLFQADTSFGILILVLYAPTAFVYGPLWLKILAAKHFREVELRCDAVAAQYVDGEALISALYLADPILNPPSGRNSRRYRNLSRLYPTLEARAEAIRSVGFVAKSAVREA